MLKFKDKYEAINYYLYNNNFKNKLFNIKELTEIETEYKTGMENLKNYFNKKEKKNSDYKL